MDGVRLGRAAAVQLPRRLARTPSPSGTRRPSSPSTCTSTPTSSTTRPTAPRTSTRSSRTSTGASSTAGWRRTGSRTEDVTARARGVSCACWPTAPRPRRVPDRLDPVRARRRPAAPPRGHPEAGQRQHRRVERVAHLRARRSASRSRCSTSLKGFVPRSGRVARRRRMGRRPGRRRCDARPLRGRCTSVSQGREDGRDGRWGHARARAADRRSSAWRCGSSPSPLLRYASVASIVTAVALPVFCRPLRRAVRRWSCYAASRLSPRSSCCTIRTSAACSPAPSRDSARGAVDAEARRTDREPSVAEATLVALLPAVARGRPSVAARSAGSGCGSPRRGAGRRRRTTGRRPSPGSRSASCTLSRRTARPKRRRGAPDVGRRRRDRGLVAGAGSDPDAALRSGGVPVRRTGRPRRSCGCRRPRRSCSRSTPGRDRIFEERSPARRRRPYYSSSSTTTGRSTRRRSAARVVASYGGRGTRVVYVRPCGPASAACVAAHELGARARRRTARRARSTRCEAEDRRTPATRRRTSCTRRSQTLVTSLVAGARRGPRRLLRRTPGTWPDVQDSPFLRWTRRAGDARRVALAGNGRVVSDIPGVSCAARCATRVGRGHGPARSRRRLRRGSASCAGRARAARGPGLACSLALAQATRRSAALFGRATFRLRVSVSGQGDG